MNKRRLAGIEKEMARFISKLFYEEIKNPKIKGLISITKVKVTEDMKFADVYVSVFNADVKEVLKGMEEIKRFLRKRVSEEMKLRYIPELRIKHDDSMEYGAKIDKILNELKH